MEQPGQGLGLLHRIGKYRYRYTDIGIEIETEIDLFERQSYTERGETETESSLYSQGHSHMTEAAGSVLRQVP